MPVSLRAPLLVRAPVGIWSIEGRWCGKTRTDLRREEGCLPDRCRSTQNGATPLQLAVNGRHEEVVQQLVAAGVPQDETNMVCGGGERSADREGYMGNTHLFVSSLNAFCENSRETLSFVKKMHNLTGNLQSNCG